MGKRLTLAGHPAGALWHCHSRAGTAAILPHLTTPWMHAHDPELPYACAYVLLVLVVLVLGRAKRSMGKAETLSLGGREAVWGRTV